MIFLGLMTVMAALAAWVFEVPRAGQVLGGLSSVLVVMLGLVFRGCRPGFTRVEKQRIFGRISD